MTRNRATTPTGSTNPFQYPAVYTRRTTNKHQPLKQIEKHKTSKQVQGAHFHTTHMGPVQKHHEHIQGIWNTNLF